MNAVSLNRRQFVKTAIAGLTLGAELMAQQPTSATTSGDIPKRLLGKTGERVSIIGIGGADIGSIRDLDESISIMHAAIDAGVTFFDNCWEYNRGFSEEVMGRALASNGRRDKVFLMTKVCARDDQGAMRQLEQSLRQLQTDRVDLWQFHGIRYDDDPDLIFDPDRGALKAALAAKKQGKIRYIGFTGHEHPRHHLAMLARDFEWDTVQMPLNLLDASYRSFQQEVLPILNFRRIGVIGMKALGRSNLIRGLGVTAEFARRYTLSLPISTLVCGIRSREQLRQDLDVARHFKPMTEQEILTVAERFKDQAINDGLEAYKAGGFGCDWHHKQASNA